MVAVEGLRGPLLKVGCNTPRLAREGYVEEAKYS